MLTDHQDIAVWVLGGLGVATLIGMALIAVQYQRGRSVLAPQQLIIRLTGGVVLLAIWGLLGALLLSISPVEQPRLFLGLFGSCGCLVLALPCLALLDLRHLLYTRLRHERDAAQLLKELLATPGSTEAGFHTAPPGRQRTQRATPEPDSFPRPGLPDRL